MSPEILTFTPTILRPSLCDIASLQPEKSWGLKKDRAGWMAHGDGHIARLLVLFSVLLEKLEHDENIFLDRDSRAAITLSIITHDLRYGSDVEFMYRQELHQKKASDQTWLKAILTQLTLQAPGIFEGVDCRKVIAIAAQINRVHDYHSSQAALTCLNAEFHEQKKEHSLEMKIFLDLDSGLEIVRLESWLYETFPQAFIPALSQFSVLENKLHQLQNPLFVSTAALHTFATALYKKSKKHPEYGHNQWAAVMKTASEMGLAA